MAGSQQQSVVGGLQGHKTSSIAVSPPINPPPSAPKIGGGAAWKRGDSSTPPPPPRYLAAHEEQPQHSRVQHRLGDVGTARLQLAAGQEAALQLSGQLHQRGALEAGHGCGMGARRQRHLVKPALVSSDPISLGYSGLGGGAQLGQGD